MRTGGAVRDAGDAFARLDMTRSDTLGSMMEAVASVSGIDARMRRYNANLHGPDRATAHARDAQMAPGPNSTLTLRPDDLTGVNVWLLQFVADSAGISVSYDAVALPLALQVGGNRTAQLAYVFETLGYDCLVTGTVARAELLSVAAFLAPNEQYGLTIVAPLAPLASTPARAVLFSWTSPCVAA